MTRRHAIHIFLVATLSVTLLFLTSSIAYAETVTFGGSACSHAYISRDGGNFVALSDISSTLGINSLYDGSRLMLGGTVHGTLIVDPNSHTLSIGNNEIDFSHNLINENGEWYVPVEFLSKALGVTAKMDPESGNLSLFPLVVAISPCGNFVRIDSSITPVFQAFELCDPPRRVIDFTDSYLDGTTLAVNGAELGVGGIRELRASQWLTDPPTVRVVLEWDSDPAPGHTLFPDNKSLSVIIGSNISGTSSGSGQNILQHVITPSENNDADDPVIIVQPDDDEIDDVQGPDVGRNDDTQTRSGNQLIDNPLIDPPVEPPDPPDPIPIEVQPEPVKPVEDPDPDGEENIPLVDLGWDIAFEMNADGEITTTITTPGFDEVDDFTLAGDGMRIVLNLKGSVLQGHGERNVSGLGEISGLRLGQFEENVTRIVFDMNRVIAYEVETDPSSGRIILRILKSDLRGKTICIDAGHGGRDSGAEGTIVDEKDLNLEMAFYLKDFLEVQGATIVMTRETDIFITLANRINIAKQANADLFVCIHNNSTEEPTALQGSLFLYNDENYMPLYRLVHRGVAARTGVPGLGPVYDERGLYVLRHADGMPVVFVEGAFMSNPVDYARLTDPSRLYSKNIMLGVMDGILAYYSGRDLPAVEYPDYGGQVDIGIFDLVGRPVVIDPDSDSGSAWGANPPETTSENSESDDSNTEDSDSSSGDSDEGSDDENSNHRLRGRGAYRYD